MKRILLIVFSFVSLGSFAQKSSLGIKAGANFSTISNVDNAETKTGFQAGAFYVYSIIEHFGVSADLLYSQEGAKNNTSKLNLNYLQIPVLANVFFNQYGDDFRPKISFG